MAVFRLLVLAFSLSVFACPHAYSDDSTNDEGEVSETEPALTPDSVLAELTLDQKIGQLFFLGFKGQKYTSDVREALQAVRPGGVVVFRKNIKSAEQISMLNHSAQTDFIDNNGVPLFIAIDQEGGVVTRIKSKPPLPSALALGQTNSRDIVGRMGFYTGTLMRALGFNMNLAPVLDVADPNKPSFIGTRSFSGDPETVGKMAFAFAQGLQMAGVVSTLKHYPGHGGPAADSHKEVPVMHDDMKTLLSTHLKPFTYLNSNLETPAIMVAHVLYPKIDREPATYSKVLVEEVLRKKLGFDGLAITDDIDMEGAKKIKDPGEQAIRAIEAGVDMIMVAWHKTSQQKAFNAVKAAVKSGRIKVARIDASVKRILDVKLRYGLFNKPPTPSMKTINMIFADPSFKRAADQVMATNIERSFQNIRVERPLDDGFKVNIFAQSPKFYQSFVQYAQDGCCRYVRFNEKTIARINGRSTDLNVIYISGAKSLNLANAIPAKYAKRVLLVNTGIPGSIKQPDRFLGVVNIYSPNAAAGELVAKYLYSAEEQEPELRDPASNEGDEAPEDSASVSKNLLKLGNSNGQSARTN
ncbi:MAG TPA: beta-N-acetylhexosaminidase [Bdellovibrionales bacterium]|nr:beta-N-acetylhexosaminidase [Bdellovibrionales bacterium]